MSLLYNLHLLTSGNPGRAHLFALSLTCVEGFSKGDTTFYLTSPAVCLHGGPKQRTKQQMQPQALRSAGLAEIERPALDLYDLAEPTHCWICGYSRRTLSGQHLQIRGESGGLFLKKPQLFPLLCLMLSFSVRPLWVSAELQLCTFIPPDCPHATVSNPLLHATVK